MIGPQVTSEVRNGEVEDQREVAELSRKEWQSRKVWQDGPPTSSGAYLSLLSSR